jgi:hypothetical protein
MTINRTIIDWLLKGDPAIRWQTQRDLLDLGQRTWAGERRRMATIGWGNRLLQKQGADGRWDGGIYSPKWTSTHYTLILLRRIGLPPNNPAARRGCRYILAHNLSHDGGINYFRSQKHSETCISGMALSFLTYFKTTGHQIEQLVAFLLREQMDDGGWNCQRHTGAHHSSVHTTISALEGLQDYLDNNGRRYVATRCAMRQGREFLLKHQLFRSDKTGEVISPSWTMLSFPPRWHYDILRSLDHFQTARAPHDCRLEEAIDIVKKKRRSDGRWPVQNRHPGKSFFEMEKTGQPSHWNTLRALRVLRWWDR